MKITYKQISEAITAGYNITVTINGEAYELTEEVNEFKEGMLFAAALIEDSQARKNSLITYKSSNKQIDNNCLLHNRTAYYTDLIEYVAGNENGCFQGFYNDYVNGELWRFKK